MIVLQEVWWLQPPGPREPGTTTHKRHFHESEYLIMLSDSEAFVHLRKKNRDGDAVGPVRTVSTSGMECVYRGVPLEVEKLSSKEPPEPAKVVANVTGPVRR